jgi:hypothetical protein
MLLVAHGGRGVRASLDPIAPSAVIGRWSLGWAVDAAIGLLRAVWSETFP